MLKLNPQRAQFGVVKLKMIVSFATISVIIMLKLGGKREPMGLLKKQEKSKKQLKSSDFIPKAGSAVTATYSKTRNRLAAIDNLSGWKKKIVKAIIYFLIFLLVMSALYGLVPSVRRGVANVWNGISIVLYGPCTGDKQLISRYNDTVRNQGVALLGDIATQVKNKRGYAKDATCVYIATVSGYAQISSKGIGEAQKQFELLSALKKENKLPSDAIEDGLDRGEMFMLIEELIKERKQNYHGQG